MYLRDTRASSEKLCTFTGPLTSRMAWTDAIRDAKGCLKGNGLLTTTRKQ